MSKSNLIENREYWVHLKNKLTARLSHKNCRAFEQVMKQVDKINFEIKKLNQVIRDNKQWM